MDAENEAKKTKIQSLVSKVYQPTNPNVGIEKSQSEPERWRSRRRIRQITHKLKKNNYKSIPVRRTYIPKCGNPTEKRPLGIPAIRDRFCQQALKNRLEPILEPSFNGFSYGYRPGRSPHEALRKIWNELMQGYCWVVDADLRDYFGSDPHEKLIDLVAEKVSDGHVVTLIRQMLKSSDVESCKYLPTMDLIVHPEKPE